MKTKERDESEYLHYTGTANSKRPRKKPRPGMRARSGKSRRAPCPGGTSEGVAADLGSASDAADSSGDIQMRSAFYREETGSSDGLFEYVL